MDRALIREGRLSEEDVRRQWQERYIPAQQLYFATFGPIDQADIVGQNDVLERPSWEVWTP